MNEFDKGKFKEGDRVVYMPLHADGDLTHPDCETGTVTRVGGKYTFVKFDKNRTDQPGVACDPDDLVSLEAK